VPESRRQAKKNMKTFSLKVSVEDMGKLDQLSESPGTTHG
jgi:hypothetical protein